MSSCVYITFINSAVVESFGCAARMVVGATVSSSSPPPPGWRKMRRNPRGARVSATATRWSPRPPWVRKHAFVRLDRSPSAAARPFGRRLRARRLANTRAACTYRRDIFSSSTRYRRFSNSSADASFRSVVFRRALVRFAAVVTAAMTFPRTVGCRGGRLPRGVRRACRE